MRLAAVAILYNPDETFFSNIQTYWDELESLIIFDNSPQKISKNAVLENKKISYFWNGENEGIARRLNQAIEICKKEKIEYLLTMDQDSSFNKDELFKYKRLIEETKIEDVGMYGVLHHHSQSSNDLKKYWLNQLLITSGSIIPVNKTDTIGPFDETLFIDGVDTEYCLRIFELGMKTILFNDIMLCHQIGSSVRKLTPSMKIAERKIHSALRMYYITRNFFYLRKKYPEQRKYLNFKPFFNELKNGILYGDEKLDFIYFFFKGYRDFTKNKMGKLWA